ncbi:MAG: PCRF domain-containing protein, partial [Candidatus Aminicenantales bacterium]
MFSQELESIEEKYRRLTLALSDPALHSNPQKFKDVSKERAELEPLIKKYEDYKKVKKHLRDAELLLADKEADAELHSLAETEHQELSAKAGKLEEELKVMLLPKDARDEKNVILEIRAGAGGDESSLFAQDLFRMYSRFSESRGWQQEVMQTSLSPIGGFKEIIVNIRGRNVYSSLKYERGVHRVQRVPRTEASGRIHT